ncbi:hypothetical protein BDV25DRAFT_157205 [Aspergillus avenaceus]|uniref:DNA (cytosine-5)-methyltransferase 1 replication foci domain-containing protein n=1 Tax=Aspergillus avenaceus TaxID=36643 RepID=A0A5N6TRM7_ASPAV|nr:hypothetical protein BDV25DRAFT_157205 [Aspergillus avenaceus]
MTSREDSVLTARDPSLADENDWEEFSLSEVRVLVPGKSRYANLLAASVDNPVQVTGCLDEVEEEQESLVLDQDYLTKRIVLENVTHYAYGQHRDGEVGIWVAGRAGWFSISPARGYRPMFTEIVEAIDLLYFLSDRHQRKRRKRKNWNPSVEYLCEEYVNHTHGICEDNDDSAEVFYKHHCFLLTRMLKGEEGVQWVNTDIFAHLCEKFPEDYEEIKAELEPPQELESEESNADDDAEEATHVPDPTAVSKMQADTIYQVILDLKEAGHLAKRQLNLDLVASTLMGRYEVDSAEYAQDLIASRADTIIELMDEAKSPTFDWSRKVIYRELKAAAKKNGVQKVALTPLRPRASHDTGSSEEDSEHEEEKPKPPMRRVLKSVLRPKSSIASKKIGKRTRSAAAADDDDDLTDENPDALNEFETPSKVRGHDLVRDPLSTTRATKRRTRSILSTSELTTPFHKTPGLQELLQTQTSDSGGGQDPSESSIAPGPSSDTWVCPVRGCELAIPKRNTKRGKDSIREHNLAHADDAKTKMDVVFSEQRLNIGFRVDNLLDHIREMGGLDLSALDGAANGTTGIGA